MITMFPSSVLFRKPLGLGSLSTLALGVALIVIPSLAQGLFSLFVFGFGKNMDLLLYVNVMSNMSWLNMVPPVIGGMLLCGVVSRFIRSHYTVDVGRVKRQTLHLSSWLLVGLLAVGCFVGLGIPTSQALNTATTGYILDTPVSDFDYLIGNYSNGNIYAINGSNWDNLVAGVGSTAWSAFTSNFTKIEELALTALSSGNGGKLLLKNVAFNLSLADSIPVGVTVVCNYGGQEYKYINPSSSAGSPYTVSVGQGLNVGYYVAEDAQNRIAFSSTNASTIITNIMIAGSKIQFNTGIFDFGTSPIIVNQHGVTIQGTGNDISGVAGTVIKYSGVGGAIQLTNATRIQGTHINDLVVLAYGAAISSATTYGIFTNDVEYGTIERVTVNGFEAGRGIYSQASATQYGSQLIIKDSFIYDCKIGISYGGNSVGHEINIPSIRDTVIIGVGKATSNSIGVHIGNYASGAILDNVNCESVDFAYYIEGDYSHLIRTRNEDVNTAYYLTASAGSNIINEPLFGGQTIHWNNTGTSNQLQSHGGNFITMTQGNTHIDGTSTTVTSGLDMVPSCVVATLGVYPPAYNDLSYDATCRTDRWQTDGSFRVIVNGGYAYNYTVSWIASNLNPTGM